MGCEYDGPAYESEGDKQRRLHREKREKRQKKLRKALLGYFDEITVSLLMEELADKDDLYARRRL